MAPSCAHPFRWPRRVPTGTPASSPSRPTVRWPHLGLLVVGSKIGSRSFDRSCVTGALPSCRLIIMTPPSGAGALGSVRCVGRERWPRLTSRSSTLWASCGIFCKRSGRRASRSSSASSRSTATQTCPARGLPTPPSQHGCRPEAHTVHAFSDPCACVQCTGVDPETHTVHAFSDPCAHAFHACTS